MRFKFLNIFVYVITYFCWYYNLFQGQEPDGTNRTNSVNDKPDWADGTFFFYCWQGGSCVHALPNIIILSLLSSTIKNFSYFFFQLISSSLEDLVRSVTKNKKVKHMYINYGYILYVLWELGIIKNFKSNFTNNFSFVSG